MKRRMRDVREFARDPPPLVLGWRLDGAEEMKFFQVAFRGPPATPYEQGVSAALRAARACCRARARHD